MVPATESGRPRLEVIEIGAESDAWRACGFALGDNGVFAAGPVVVRLTDEQRPVRLRLSNPVAGLERCAAAGPPQQTPHPNGVFAVDHVVIATRDPDTLTSALTDAGAELRGIRQAMAGGVEIEQRFLPLPGGLIELVASPAAPESPVIWGITFACADPDQVAAHWPVQVSPPHDAIQPGRRIATIGKNAGLGARVALISPRIASA